jgi:hypothetical protein
VKSLYDWLILPPAVVIDYALYCLLGHCFSCCAQAAWHCTIKLIDENRIDWKDYPARPSRAITWVVAIAISAYVAIVCVTAIYELPRVSYKIAGPENSN